MPEVQLLQIREVLPVACSNACSFCLFILPMISFFAVTDRGLRVQQAAKTELENETNTFSKLVRRSHDDKHF